MKPLNIWGKEFIDDPTMKQMQRCMSLPITVAGALMPDAHLGYGLPIGGVLATKDAVIPYAVGVDIACRVMLSVLPITQVGSQDPLNILGNDLKEAIDESTCFGVGSSFETEDRRQHKVLDDPRWGTLERHIPDIVDLAWRQLGTSGAGNHFIDIGMLELQEPYQTGDNGGTHRLDAGTYLAILTHSGSRGPGYKVCNHYSQIAQWMNVSLSDEQKHLAWLPLDTEEGQEYWNAMELMGEYASANHHLIHQGIYNHLNVSPSLVIENHHNFAWKVNPTGLPEDEIILHRKGATPAEEGDVGAIPGTFASPTFVVRGLGNEQALWSSAHGAGRALSRKKAKMSLSWDMIEPTLKKEKIEVMSSSLDELPFAYKCIERIMKAQKDLVEIFGVFHPRLVKMATGKKLHRTS